MFLTWDRLHRLPGKFALVRCSDCQLVRLSPRPVLDQLGFYYPEDEYYSYQNPVNLSSVVVTWRDQFKAALRNSVLQWKGYPVSDLARWQRILQPLVVAAFGHRLPYGFGVRFPQYVPGGKALEIGCGSGTFLALLKHHGWQVAGVEISQTAAAAAKRELGIEVFAGDLSKAPFAPESFDYIHMSHVIEHLPEPLEALQTITRWLKPHGKVYIETPNIDSFARRSLKNYWLNWDTPRHLCLFTPVTLRETATAAGLRIKKLSTTTETHYLWSEVYRCEEQTQQPLPNRPIFPNLPDLGIRTAWRGKIFKLLDSLAHVYNPLSGSVLCCWATKR